MLPFKLKWTVLKKILKFTLKLTLKQPTLANTSNALPDGGVTVAPKYAEAVLM